MVDQADEADVMARAQQARRDIDRFMNLYRFGIREIETKLSILREDFLSTHEYNPIEHVSSRLKTIDSILQKVQRKAIDPLVDDIRDHISDIAGVRVTCSFVSDTYRLFDLLTSQHDLTVREVKDYIAAPKPNGYKSLHAIIDVPVFLSTGTETVPVEVQFRTIAMDFWASLEHKIYYKYDAQVPERLIHDLTEAAHAAAELDDRMERLHHEVKGAIAPPMSPIQPPTDDHTHGA